MTCLFWLHTMQRDALFANHSGRYDEGINWNIIHISVCIH